MEKLSESIITNRELRDSSAKLIFSDNTLCSQFLRDYRGMDILRHIKPEDLEDVSDRYVPLFSPERNSDTVKKINISPYIGSTEDENSLNLPLFIVSLLEHKTKVEYNVCMQVLRYAVQIWAEYEKEMEKYLLDLLTKLLRALAYSMGMSEDETEDAVGIIKERKMGRLFENQTINIPEMRREIAELKLECDNLKTKRDSLQAENNNLRTKRDNLQSENTNLQPQLQKERQNTAQAMTQVQKDFNPRTKVFID